jgi:D-alanyl-D-alanine dipeptidase
MSIIYLASAEILAIPIVECGEELIDIKNSDILSYGPPPECPLTASCYTKMRKSVFEKLCQAQSELPHGWRFRLYEGLRSLAVQQMLFEQEYERVVKRYPQVSHQDRFRETTRLVSPVINLDGSTNIPPHNTGAAIDIEIVTANGDLVDMGMAIADWTTVTPEFCMTHYEEIPEIVKTNRELLLSILSAHGFVNYPAEWWHFSYGDRYWAYHKKQSHAIYGPAENFL